MSDESDDTARVGTALLRSSPHWPSGRSEVVGVMGDPIRHSLSPLLHNAAFDAMALDWVSVAFEVPDGQAVAALAGARALGIAGLSVTMPHKQAAAAAVDERSPLATRLGAVNCVTRRGERLIGDSTDGPGFLQALERATGFEPAGRRCLVVGAGGAARAVVVALAEAGAAAVVVLNRDARRGSAAAELAGAVGRVGTTGDLGPAELVVQATPVGMLGDDEVPALVDIGLLNPGQVVADLVYLPARTPLLERAEAAGATVCNGLGMLVHQAALALEQWTGAPVPVEAMWAAALGSLGGRSPV